mgnify:CR=1 FL=1
MSLRLSHTTWDALDPHAIAEFWRALLGWEVDEPHLYRPGSDECSLVGPDGQVVLFFRVPDAKRVKNRAHMDLAVEGGSTRDAKKVCVGCEVRSECLEYALLHDERFGIWGGLSAEERRRMTAVQAATAV